MKKIITWVAIGFVVIVVFSFLFGGKPMDNTTPANGNQTNTEEASTSYEPTDEEIDKLATDYCQERKNDSRVYPIPVKTDVDNKRPYEIANDSRKSGSSLTHDDCLTMINYLVWFKNYSAMVATTDIPSVVARKYWIGMNIAELTASIGWPDDINTTNYGGNKTEQWIYYKDSQRVNAYYFYTKDSKVTSYQDF